LILCSFVFQWLRETNRKPLLAAVEKMKEGIFQVKKTSDAAESSSSSFAYK
jgi:hypothetical protein